MSTSTDSAGAPPLGQQPNPDAVLADLLSRAGTAPKQSIFACETLIAEIVQSAVPGEAFKLLASEIAKATGFDRDEIVCKLKRGRQAAGHQTTPGPTSSPSTGAATEQEAWIACKPLAERTDLVSFLLATVLRLGVAGDKRGILATFLVAISRLLDVPARMLRKGAAASGKSHVIEKGLLPLLNPYDYVVMTAGSAKALVYSNRDFKHVLLFIPEAAALVTGKNSGDEFAMMLRELISSGRIEYATVHPDPKGKPVGAVISKDGPVAFLMTTARENVEEELATRMLVTVSDETDGQTQKVLDSIASAAAGAGPNKVSEAELAAWRSFQDWLRLGARDVVVPFAPVIAALTDRRAVRIRRDFPGLLALVKASALMHRAQRDTDSKGRVIAKLEDYTIALGAVGDGLEELVHGDIAAIEAVRRGVRLALSRHRQNAGRMRMIGTFRQELLTYLRNKNLNDAVARLIAAGKTNSGRQAVGTVAGCVSIAIGMGDPAVQADPLVTQADATRLLIFRKARRRALADARKPDGRPGYVELSGQQLATALGLGRHAARIRLENALEVGAVIDVGADNPGRSRTSPKCLKPGAPAVPPTSSPATRRKGAFPNVKAVAAAWEASTGASGVKTSGQAAKFGLTP